MPGLQITNSAQQKGFASPPSHLIIPARLVQPSITVRSQRTAQVTPRISHSPSAARHWKADRINRFPFLSTITLLSFYPLLLLFIYFFISSLFSVRGFFCQKKGKRKRKKKKKGEEEKEEKESPANSPSRRSFSCVSRRSERSTDGT